MTNKDKYKQAFSVLHASDALSMEIIERKPHSAGITMARKAATCAVCFLLIVTFSITAYAAVNDISIGEIFGRWLYGESYSPEQASGLESVGTTDFGLKPDANGDFIGIESNGTTVTPIAVITDGYSFYMQLKIEVPDEITLSTIGQYEAYTLTGGNFIDFFPGYSGGYAQGELSVDGNRDTSHGIVVLDEHTMLCTIYYYLYQTDNTELPETFHFEGVWLHMKDKGYTQIVSGSWDIPLKNIKVSEPVIYQMAPEFGGGELSVTNLSCYLFGNNGEGDGTEYDAASFDIAVMLKDGSKVLYDRVNQVWERPIDTAQIVQLTVNNVELVF